MTTVKRYQIRPHPIRVDSAGALVKTEGYEMIMRTFWAIVVTGFLIGGSGCCQLRAFMCGAPCGGRAATSCSSGGLRNGACLRLWRTGGHLRRLCGVRYGISLRHLQHRDLLAKKLPTSAQLAWALWMHGLF